MDRKKLRGDSRITLMLLYEPDTARGNPVPVARTANLDLIVAVANAVVQEALARAEALAREDDLLGEVEREEACRLRRVLELLVPALRTTVTESSHSVM